MTGSGLQIWSLFSLCTGLWSPLESGPSAGPLWLWAFGLSDSKLWQLILTLLNSPFQSRMEFDLTQFQWWLAPCIHSLSSCPLFLGAEGSWSLLFKQWSSIYSLARLWEGANRQTLLLTRVRWSHTNSPMSWTLSRIPVWRRRAELDGCNKIIYYIKLMLFKYLVSSRQLLWYKIDLYVFL